MPDIKIILGILGTVVGLIGYIPYFLDIFKGKTKPHFFSWFIWSILTWIAFFAQIVGNAGPGAWVTGMTAFLCLLVSILAIKRGEKQITKVDWVCFIGAILGILIWIKTNNPLFAVILVTVIDAIAYVPTFRKSYYRPDEETLMEYILAFFKFIISLFALQSFTLITALYPLSLVVTNGLFVIMVIIRKKQISNGSKKLVN